MAPSMTNKQLITEYLELLSRRPKTRSLLQMYINDEKLIEHIGHVDKAFPGYRLIAEQMVAEGDLVAVRATFKGVHAGEFDGIPPTHCAVQAGLMIIYRISADRIVDHWMQFDIAGLRNQLTAAPAAKATAS
jgi:hypothetical protein